MREGATRWTVRADRRAGRVGDVQAELTALGEVVDGLIVALEDPVALAARPDLGAFRDFVVVATLDAPDARILERVGEELIAEFGFTVDWRLAPEG